jgi:hypothetical protein
MEIVLYYSFPGKKLFQKYVYIVQDAVCTDEVEVMAPKCFSDSKSTFSANESDLSIIKTFQILQKLQSQLWLVQEITRSIPFRIILMWTVSSL